MLDKDETLSPNVEPHVLAVRRAMAARAAADEALRLATEEARKIAQTRKAEEAAALTRNRQIAAERAKKISVARAKIANIEAALEEYITSAREEHEREARNLLEHMDLTMEDIKGKPTKTPVNYEMPKNWARGDSIDSQGYVVASSNNNVVYVMGQKGQRSSAFHKARELALAREKEVD
jgi:hypothetical protein